MKKILLKKEALLLVMLLSGFFAYSQDLYVGSGGDITITPGNFMLVSNNLDVEPGATVTINSDANNFGSLLVVGNTNTTSGIVYNRYSEAGVFHLISPPLNSVNAVADFVRNNSILQNPSNSNYAVSYYKPDNSAGFSKWTWYNEVSTADENKETFPNFVEGVGYSMRRTNDGTYNYSGTISNTDFSISLESVGAHRWQAISSPFPSFLPINAGGSEGANFLSTDSNSSKLDFFFNAIYVELGTGYSPINYATADYYLAPGEGFLVRPRDGDEVFVFSKTIQVHQSEISVVSKSVNLPEVNVFLTSGNLTSNTVVKYKDNATLGLDVGYDAGAYEEDKSSLSVNTRLVTGRQDVNMALQVLPNYDYESSVIPLSVTILSNQKAAFSASKENLPNGMNVYLEDRLKNVFHQIDNEKYTFNAASSIDGPGRFYLHIARSKPNSGLADEDQGSVNPLIYKLSANTIRVRGFEGENTVISLYDVTGKEVLRKTFLGSSFNDITISGEIKRGIYIAKVVGQTESTTKKLIID